MRQSILVLLSVLLVTKTLFAQQQLDYSLQTYTLKDGLPDEGLRYIYQDRLGRLWITTTSTGITVYDGKKFTAIGEEDGLSSNMSFRTTQAADGTMWVATKNGISKINTTGTIDTFLTDLKPEKKNFFTTVVVDSNQQVWAGGFSGLYQFNKNKFVKINLPNIHNALFGIAKYGKIYFTTDAGLLIFKDGKFRLYGEKEGILSKNMYCLFPYANNKLLIGGFDGFFDYDIETKVCKKIVSDKNEIISALSIESIDDNQYLIASGTNEIFIFNGQNLVRTSLKLNDPIIYIKKDIFQNVWMAGKYLYCLKKNFFTEIDTIPSIFQDYTIQKYLGNHQYALAKDSFLVCINGKNKYSNYTIKNEIINYLFSKSNELFIGTVSGALYVMTEQKKIKKILNENFVHAQSDIVHRVWINENGDLYVLRNFTIFRKLHNQDNFYQLVPPGNNQFNYAYWSIANNVQNQTTYIGTSNGIFYCSNNLTDTILKPLSSVKTGGFVSAIAVDKYGTIWFAEDGKGVTIVADNKIKKFITLDNGLPFTEIKALYIDSSNNNCWIVHIGGITKVNFNKDYSLQLFNFYGGEQGLPNDINNSNFLNKNLILSNASGFYIKNNFNPSPKQIFTYELLNRDWNKIQQITNYHLLKPEENIHLNKGGDQFSFELNCLSNYQNAFYPIKYDLQGGYIHLSNQQKGSILNLGYLTPGKYKLGIASNGSFKQSNFTFNIFVPAFWYQTLSFKIALTFVLLVIILYLYSKLRLQKLKKNQIKLQQEKEKITLENKVLKSQLDPHIVFNLLNNIQSKILFNNKEKAIEEVLDLSDFLRMSLDFSKQEEIYLSEEIHYLKTLLNLKAGHNKKNIHTTFIDDISSKNIDGKIPSLLWQPLLENALKYCDGEIKRIVVHFYEYENYIVGEIKNTVLANFTFPEKFTGNGLRLVKERIALLNKIYANHTAIFKTHVADDWVNMQIFLSKNYVLNGTANSSISVR